MKFPATVYIMLVACLDAGLASRLTAQEFEREPIRYSQSAANDRVSKLIERIDAGQAELLFEPQFGYLRALLAQLEVPLSSQMLVYSKTSLQRQRISPRTPRALYFSDDVYVGYCQFGDVLEISAVDPALGAVFYTLEQDNQVPPKIVRQGDNCLICHGSSQTKDVPGYLVRSMYVDPSGLPILSAGTYRIDHSSPLEKRWGGWYVTGTHGPQKHLGNLLIRGKTVPANVDNAEGLNVLDLGDRFDKSAYLSAHSDLVSLMVLEHQADAHNLITRANFLSRQAMHYQQSLNRELGEPADRVWDSTRSRIKSAGEPLVEYLLFSGEAELTHRVQGTSDFAAEFAQRGPRDRHSRSLREFDLERRLFKYPCSYLIYSPSFASLPMDIKSYVWDRLWQVLNGQDQTKEFSHLTLDERRTILEILQDTVPDLPSVWRLDK